MPSERIAPDAVLDATNYTTLLLASIQEDPDSPDVLWGSWNSGNTSCRVSFPTPSGTPSGTQEFRVLIRKAGGAGGNLPAWSLELWEAGVLVSVLSSGTVSSTTGTVVAGTFDASQLVGASGADVECLLVQTDGGTGKPADRRGIEVGAVEWNAVTAAAGTTGTGAAVAQPAACAAVGSSGSAGTGAPTAGAASTAGVGASGSPGLASVAAAAVLCAAIGLSGSVGSGASVSGTALSAGAGVSSTSGSGTAASGPATCVGTGASGSTGSGACVAASAVSSGNDSVPATGTGICAAAPAISVGSGSSGSAGFGIVEAQVGSVSAAGSAGSVGTVVAGAGLVASAGVGSSGSTGTGDVVSGPASCLGLDEPAIEPESISIVARADDAADIPASRETGATVVAKLVDSVQLD